MTTFDITVRGAGIFGLSVAHACLQRGARVQVVDPGWVASGASGGLVGALAPHTPENWNAKKQFQLESLLMARTFWPAIEALTGLSSGYAPTGRLQPLPDDRALRLARDRASGAKAFWGDAADWQVIAASNQPWEPPSQTGMLVHDTLSAHIHPRQATLALAAAVEALGAPVRAEAPDQGLVVWATGAAGLAALSEGAPRPLGSSVKGQAALLEFDARGAPQMFADALHVVPHLDGTVAIGSTSEREFEDPVSCDGLLDDLLVRAVAVFPLLRDAPVIGRWAGLRPRARSRAPMLGCWPDRPGHFVANGGFKIGFGMAPKVGEVMADLLLDGRVSYPEDFDVSANL